VLASYSSPIIHIGRVGDGQRVKLLNNALFAGNIALVAEAERVAGALGVDPAAALGAIAHCSGNSFSLGMINGIGSAAAARASVGKFIGKDVATVRRVADDLGVDLGVLGTAAFRAVDPS
jgi:3-hydroxyisobutyrate dehydrogenase-like beta-hydroxyacid dehydrogenase